jgi:hypothetical protein
MSTNDERLATLEAQFCEHDKVITLMGSDIREIKDKLMRRPSWAVSVIITLLTGLCVGLSVFIITKI